MIEYRQASTLEIRHAERIIDLIAVPYNEPTEVLHNDRWITEKVAPAAFAGVHGDVTVNRAHDLERPCGIVRKLSPGDPRGLRAELRISRIPAGDEVLELAADRLLGASIGFLPLPGGQEWSTDRQSRTITKARLVHIALTGNPAYQGAQVLAVRTADHRVSATPNLDRLRLEMLADAAGVHLSSTP
jgi:HK97 family phage prohead protease